LATSSSRSVSKSRSRGAVSGRSRLRGSLKAWQIRLGLQAWKITLTRTLPEEVEVTPYAGITDDSKTQAGMCMVDAHGMKAHIYVAPEEELAGCGLDEEQVLLHEMLHIRLVGLEMIPGTEPIGHTLALENVVNALTKAFLPGTRVA
jgi:hypothetical protein